MNAVQKIKQNLDPDVMVRIVQEDPGHQDRVKARSERERKAYYNAVEKELEAALEQCKKERRAYELKMSSVSIDHAASSATICVAALIIGYLLSFV